MAAVPLLVMLLVRGLVDPDSVRDRIVTAAERATGRRLAIGDFDIALSLRPTVELRDVTLANPPGASRPQMLSARRVEVRAALLPLLFRRLEITSVEVDGPDLLLELDAEGRGNWQFTPPPAAAPAPGTATPPAGEPARPMAVAVERLQMTRGRIGWRDAAGRSETLELTSLEASAPADAPLRAEGRLALRGQPVAMTLTGGRLEALGGAAPWPMTVTLAAAGAEARLQATLAAGAAWTVRGEARAADLARFASAVPDLPLPPLRDVTLSGAATGTGGAVAALTDLRLRAGASDLAVLRPGLRLRQAEATAARLDAPLTLQAEAAVGSVPLRLAGQFGTPAQLAGRAEGALPVDLRLETEGAWLTLQGNVAEPRALAGIDLAVAGEAAQLAALSPLAGTPLPALADAKLAFRLAERTPAFAGGAHLRGLVASAAPGELRGDLTVVVGERPGLTGALASPRLDLDAALAGRPQAAAPAPAAAPSPAPAPAATAEAPRPAARSIPDLPLPVALLRILDADLRLAVAELVLGGETWREVAAQIGLDAGQLRVAPLSATTPAGSLALEIAADVRGELPAVQAKGRATSLDLAVAQRLLGLVPGLTGRAQLDASLAGQGSDLRALAGSLGGHVGLALVDGTIPREALRGIPEAVRAVLLPAGLPDGAIPLRCLALRAPAEQGVLRIRTLYAEGPLGRIGGNGAIDLGEETLALRLQTDLRAGRVAVRAPVTVSGRWAAPRIGVDPAEAAAAGLGALLSQQQTPDRSLQALADLLGGQRGQQAVAAMPDCTAALASARGGIPGPAPTTPGVPEVVAQPGAAQPGAAQPGAPAAPAAPAAQGGFFQRLFGR